MFLPLPNPKLSCNISNIPCFLIWKVNHVICEINLLVHFGWCNRCVIYEFPIYSIFSIFDPEGIPMIYMLYEYLPIYITAYISVISENKIFSPKFFHLIRFCVLYMSFLSIQFLVSLILKEFQWYTCYMNTCLFTSLPTSQ